MLANKCPIFLLLNHLRCILGPWHCLDSDEELLNVLHAKYHWSAGKIDPISERFGIITWSSYRRHLQSHRNGRC